MFATLLSMLLGVKWTPDGTRRADLRATQLQEAMQRWHKQEKRAVEKRSHHGSRFVWYNNIVKQFSVS